MAAAQKVTIVLNAEGSEAVSKVFADLAAKGKDFAKNVSGGANEANTATQGLIGQIKNLKGAFESGAGGAALFNIALTALTNPVVALVTAVGAAVFAVSKFTDTLVEDAKAVKALANVSGLSIEASVGLRNAFELMGKDSDSLKAALFKLSTEIDSGGQKLKLFGINVRDSVTGALKEPGEVMLELRTRMSQMTNTAQQNAVGVELLGKQYREIASIFKLTDAQMQALIERGKQLNPMNAETVRLVTELKKSENELKLARAGLTDDIAERTLPSQIALNKQLTEQTLRMQKLTQEVIDFLAKPGAEWYDWLSRMTNGYLGMAKAQQIARGMLPPIPGGPIPGGNEQPGDLGVGKIATVSLDALKAIEDLKKQLAILSQPDAQQGIARIRQQFEEFAQKEGPAAAKAAAGVFGALIEVEQIKLDRTLGEPINAMIKTLTDGVAQASVAGNDFLKAWLPVEAMLAALPDKFAGVLPGMREFANNMLLAKDNATTTAEAFKAVGEGLPQSTKNLLDAAAMWSALSVALDKVRTSADATTDPMKTLTDEIKLSQDALLDFQARFGDTTDDAEVLTKRIIDLGDSLMRLQTFRDTADTVRTAFRIATASAQDATQALGNYAGALGRAEQESVALGQSSGQQLAAKIQITEDAITSLGRRFGFSSAEVQHLQDRLAGFKADQFTQTLKDINMQAAVLGDDFDAMGPTISAMEKRLIDLGRAAGEVTPDMRALGAELQSLKEAARTKDMLREFTDGFGQSLQVLHSFLSTAKDGLSEFFQLVGRGLTGQVASWKAFADAVKGIWANMLNSIIKALSDWLASAIVKQFIAVVNSSGSATIPGGGTATLGGGSGASGAGGGPDSGFDFTTITKFGNTLTSTTSNLAEFGGGLLTWAGNFTGIGAETLGPAATGIQTIDMLQAGANISQVSEALQAAAPAVSTFGVLLAGVGAAMTVFSGIMDLVNGQTERGIGTLSGALVGGIAGGIIGSMYPGIGTLIGALVGVGVGGAAGGFLGGLFGGPSEFDIKRNIAQSTASKGVGALVGAYQMAATSGDITKVQAALAGTQAGGHVRVDLNLPDDLAQQMGIAAGTTWADLSSDQFGRVLNAFKSNPALMQQAIVGSGDVPYLGAGPAAEAAKQAKDAAIALITIFNDIGDFTDRVTKLADGLNLAAKLSLPPDFAAAVEHGMVDPLKAGMLALVDSGLSAEAMTTALEGFQQQSKDITDIINLTAAAMAQFAQIGVQVQTAFADNPVGAGVTTMLSKIKQQMVDVLGSGLDTGTIKARMEELQRQEAVIGSLVAQYDTLDQEILAMTNDMQGLTDRAIVGHQANMAQLEKNVETAQNMLDTRRGPNVSPEEELAMIDAVHQAIVARYQYEMQAVQAIEAAITNTLKTYGAPLNALTTQIGLFDIANKGSVDVMAGLISNMTNVALTSKSAAEAAWAFDQAMGAIIVTGQALAASTGKAAAATGLDASAASLDAIIQAMYDQAAPLLAHLQADVDTAVSEGNLKGALELLQKEAAAAQALAQGAIAAVQAWATAAIDAINTAADANVKAITTQAKAETDVLEKRAKGIADEIAANDKLIKGKNREIELIQRAADVVIRANQDRIDGLNDEIDGIQKVAAASIKRNDADIKGLTKAIDLIEKQAAAQIKLNDASIKRLSKDIDGIEKIAAAQIKLNDADLRGLNKQIDTAEKLAAAATKLNDLELRRLSKDIDGIERIAAAATKLNDGAIRGLEKQISTAEKLAAADMKLNDQEIKRLTKDINAAEKIANAQMKANDLELRGIDKRMDAISQAARAQEDANRRELDALGARRDALRESLDAAKAWRATVDSMAKQLNDLMLGQDAPFNPMQQLDMARAAFQDALSHATTPEGIAKAQEAASDYLKAGQGVFARPSSEYQNIFGEVTGALKGMQGTAAANVPGNIDSLEAELNDVTAQMQMLEAANKALETATRDQLAPLQAQADALKALNDAIKEDLDARVDPMKEQVDALQELNAAIKEDLDARTGPLKEQIDALQELNQSIKDDADARTGPLKDNVEALQDLNQSIKDTLDATVGPLKDQVDALQELSQTIRDDADARTGPLKEQVETLQDLNDAIRDDVDARTGPMKEQVEALQDLNTGIKDFADEQIEPLKATVDDLTKTNKDLKRTADDQVQALRDQITALQDTNDGLADDEKAIRDNITAINENRDLAIAAVNADRAAWIEQIKAEATRQIQGINEGLTATLQNIAGQQTPIYNDMLQKQKDIENAITGGASVQDFIKTATQAAAADLALIRSQLDAYLTALAARPDPFGPGTPAGPGTGPGGGQPSGPTTGPGGGHVPGAVQTVWPPEPPFVPPPGAEGLQPIGTFGFWQDYGGRLDPRFYGPAISASTGAWRTQEGPYYLHANEMVLKATDADRYRRDNNTSRGAATVNLTIAPGAIVITGVADPEAAANLAVKKIEESARVGRLSEIFKRQRNAG